MDMNEQDLKTLLDEVKTEFAKAVKSEEEQDLAKSEDTDSESKKLEAKGEEKIAKAEEKEDKEEEKEDKEEEAKKEEDEDEEKKKKDKEEKEKMKKECGEDEEDEEEEEEEKEMEKKAKKSESASDYESMTKAERADHYRKLKPLIWKDEGFEVPSESKSSETKEEEKPTTLVKAEEIKDLEEELKSKSAKIEELEKSVGEITKAFDTIVNGPNRKSVASIDEIVGKPTGEGEIAPKDLSTAQIKSQLGKLKPAGLEKNDREAINTFFIEESNTDEVLKLLERK